MTILQQIGAAVGRALKNFARRDLSNVPTEAIVARIPGSFGASTYTAVNRAAMLSLDARPGDLCFRLETREAYRLREAPASSIGNWELVFVSPPDNGPVPTTMTFAFDSTLSLVIPHGTGRRPVSVTVLDDEGRVHYAGWSAPEGNVIFVDFTEAVAGTCSVVFPEQ